MRRSTAKAETTLDFKAIKAIEAKWKAFDTMVQLRRIKTESEYNRMLALLNSLLNTAGDDEEHPLSSLLDLVADLIAAYEQEHFAIEQAEPRETLRFLLEARGLTQADLAALVPQGNLSAILAGKRKISATLAGKLGAFFGVSAAVFVPRPSAN